MTNKPITPETGNPHSDPASGITSQSGDCAFLKRRLDEALQAERTLSDAYVRLREIIGAMSPPSLTDPAALYYYVESKARELSARASAGAAPTAPAEPTDTVPVPTNPDQAAAMTLIGEAWLRQHAPERLAAAAPQAEPKLQTCNCRWDGETQVTECTLHAAHKEAIHDWAERAKAAEDRLAAPQAEPQPLTDEQVGAAVEAWFNAAYSAASEDYPRRMRAAFAAAGIAAAPQAEPHPQPQFLLVSMDDDGMGHPQFCADKKDVSAKLLPLMFFLQPGEALSKEDADQFDANVDALLEDGFLRFEGDPSIYLYRLRKADTVTAPKGDA